jgi:hypothetical protein
LIWIGEGYSRTSGRSLCCPQPEESLPLFQRCRHQSRSRSPATQPSEESQTMSVQLIISMVAMAVSVLILVLGVVYFTGSEE